MKDQIDGSPEEIADLIVGIQERRAQETNWGISGEPQEGPSDGLIAVFQEKFQKYFSESATGKEVSP